MNKTIEKNKSHEGEKKTLIIIDDGKAKKINNEPTTCWLICRECDFTESLCVKPFLKGVCTKCDGTTEAVPTRTVLDTLEEVED